MSNIEQYNSDIFGKIKNINEYGQEFWYARELAKILEYTKWGNFKKVIDKAKEASNNSDIDVLDHYADVSKMVQLGSGSERKIEDIMLSRYACYIIVQNADSRKKVVALGRGSCFIFNY
ncbi:BRO family protein [Clostridium estertheticum]|uniref:BRO family protein n=1 Tax=Clostridium estertheticum TaxID=238834 RepID=UPI00209B2284|nr:BRO family protein [Clostridium estertheticum]